MKIYRQVLDRFFTTHKPLPAGMYAFQSKPEEADQYRMHLRLEPDGLGLLILNASTVVHLNQTAAELVYHLIKATPEEEVVRLVAGRYRVKADQVRQDYQSVKDRLKRLALTTDLDPQTYLDFERLDPYVLDISAPYRLDCALTYQGQDDSALHSAPVDRVKRELLTAEWQSILDKAWSAGIPHVIFTGGEPTLRPDLIDLIAYTEKIGMVCGLLTDGLRLTDPAYLQSVLQSGLDHLMLILDDKNEQSWHALRDLLPEDLAVTVHMTLTPRNAVEFTDILSRLALMGVKKVSLSASEASLNQELTRARNAAASNQMSLVWDLPVPYSTFHPVALELQEEPVVEGAGKAWLYVEPDGDVLPAQGVNQGMGNLLQDSWQDIWSHRPDLAAHEKRPA